MTHGRDDEIREFLRNNILLGPIVAEAYGKLQKLFPYSTIIMEVVQDELVISIETTLSPEEAIEQLDRFDDEWWLDIASSLDSFTKLCVRVEYQ